MLCIPVSVAVFGRGRLDAGLDNETSPIGAASSYLQYNPSLPRGPFARGAAGCCMTMMLSWLPADIRRTKQHNISNIHSERLANATCSTSKTT